MATINDLIKQAYRKLNVVGIGENLDAYQLTEGLGAVNSLIDSWNTDKLIPFYNAREDFNLVSGTQSYTIGSGGVFNTTRPIEILSASVTDTGLSYPVLIISTEEWLKIRNKAESSDLPAYLYYEPGMPLGTIYLWRKPSANNVLTIMSKKQIGSFVSGDAVSLPPSYEKAMVDNLALELLPFYPSESLFPLLDRQARASLERLKRANIMQNITPMDIDIAPNHYSNGYAW